MKRNIMTIKVVYRVAYKPMSKICWKAVRLLVSARNPEADYMMIVTRALRPTISKAIEQCEVITMLPTSALKRWR